MANISDYVKWRGDLSFKKSPPNDVDIVILSQIVLNDLSKCVPKRGGITLKDCAEKFFSTRKKVKKPGLIIPAAIPLIFGEMADTARFRGLILSRYVDDIDESTDVQFSALTCDAPEINERFVIYSGTDDTVVGWRENFNLIYKTPTCAQTEAVKYLESAAEGFNGKIIVLGHSKGGHLAVYACVNCSNEAFGKIRRAVNLDGPGIPENDDANTKYFSRHDKIITILPQSSVIGRLFEHGEEFMIVHSTGEGLFQHDAFSWEVLGTSLVKENGFTEDGTGVDNGLRVILDGMDEAERERFVEGLFGLFYAAKCSTLTELSTGWREVVKAYFRAPSETKKALNRAFSKVLANKYLRRSIFETMRYMKNFNENDEKNLTALESFEVGEEKIKLR
ncbi:MAG: DUF2974 domain-containing protein [Clostridia bacterium]|nr:DUF2974 domain-containing protein [Clostridia bacterium]